MNSYPFFKGEPYFETEIKYLVNNFESITIFSIVAQKKETRTREVPEGVNIVTLNCPKHHVLNLLRGLFVHDKDFRSKRLTFKKWLIFKYSIGRNYSIFKKAIKYLRRQKTNFDDSLIYSYWLSFGMAAIKIKKFLLKNNFNNVKIISRAHGYDLFWERMPLGFAPLQEMVIKHSDGVYSVSETGQIYLQNKYDALSDKIHLSRLGTEDHGISSLFDCELHNSFVSCSNNRPVKRLDLFARSFAQFIKFDNSAKWNAVGLNGSESEIASVFNDDEIKTNVMFYGFLKNMQIYEVYKTIKIDFLINVSSSEGLPVSIMEALSFGIPVIATNVGGTKELVDETCGFLIDKNITESELERILRKASQISYDDYIAMRRGARKKWELVASAETNYFDWVNNIKEV